MTNPPDPSADRRSTEENEGETPTSRRRLLQIAGVGLAGAAALSTGTSAQASPDRFEIAATGDTAVDYSFACAGTVEVIENRGSVTTDTVGDNCVRRFDASECRNPSRAGTRQDESNRRIVVANDDGMPTVAGRVEPGDADIFECGGDVTAFEPGDGDYRLYLNGREITRNEVVTAEHHELEITTPHAVSIEYSLTATGRITKGGTGAAGGSSEVVENDNGTWTATGLTGTGARLVFEGEATAFEPRSGECSLSLDGQPVTMCGLVGEDPSFHTLEIVTPEHSAVEYEFTADGRIAKELDNGTDAAEASDDTIVQNSDGTWTARGSTGDGYDDTYDIEGEIVAFVANSGDFGLYLDDEQATVPGLTIDKADDVTDDGSDSAESEAETARTIVMGGDTGDAAIVARSDADLVVRTARGLADALGSASAGEVVFVVGNAAIDTGEREFDIPGGVTLASNRGQDGAPGALLATDNDPDAVLRVTGSDARVTGLRLRGPCPDALVTDRGRISDADTGPGGITIEGADCEVDNNDIAGFGHAGVNVAHDSDGNRVHHNDVQ